MRAGTHSPATFTDFSDEDLVLRCSAPLIEWWVWPKIQAMWVWKKPSGLVPEEHIGDIIQRILRVTGCQAGGVVGDDDCRFAGRLQLPK